jgi:hypothetical protein
MGDPVSPSRTWLGPLCVDTVGPAVDASLELVLAIAPVLTPETKAACQEDAQLIDRLLKETSRRQVEGLVLGGRTGRTLIDAVSRILVATRDDLQGRDELDREPLAVVVSRLSAQLEALERAARTLEAEAGAPDA